MDEFKQTDFPKKNNFSGKFFTSFLSGALGACLVVGVCFGVPEVKSKLIKGNTSSITSNVKTSTSSSEISKDLVDLVEYSDTSVAVAR